MDFLKETNGFWIKKVKKKKLTRISLGGKKKLRIIISVENLERSRTFNLPIFGPRTYVMQSFHGFIRRSA